MNNKLDNVTLWASRLLWPTLLIVGWWSLRIEVDWTFRIVSVLLTVMSIFWAWWQKRLYLAAISLIFIATGGIFAYLQLVNYDLFNEIASYVVLIYSLAVAIFASFATYTLKVQNPYVMVYLVGAIFILIEFFWLLASLTADPLISAVLITGLFHLSFSLIALNAWNKLKPANFRWYLLGSIIFFAIFIRLL